MGAFFAHHGVDVRISTSTPGGDLPVLEEDEALRQQWDRGEVKAIAYLWANHWVPVLHPSVGKKADNKDKSPTARLARHLLKDAIVPQVDCTGNCGPETARLLLEAMMA